MSEIISFRILWYASVRYSWFPVHRRYKVEIRTFRDKLRDDPKEKRYSFHSILERNYIYIYIYILRVSREKNQFIYTWIKVETGITLCVLLRIARTMSAAASPIVVLVYPFRHLTVGPLKPREESKIIIIVIVWTRSFRAISGGRVERHIHSQSDHLFGKFVPSFLVGLEADIGQNVAKLYTRDIHSRPEWN